MKSKTIVSIKMKLAILDRQTQIIQLLYLINQ